jgi:hypothetical protein
MPFTVLPPPSRFPWLVAAFALLGALALSGGCAKQATSPAEEEAEAKRLYARADDFVRKIGEGTYSYEYINFHYNQANRNIERILTAYPGTEVGRKLKAGELKLGTYAIEQFRDTILPQLGDMKEATESFENCAIYLHTLPEAARPETRAALALILETLCRKARADEALIFPTLPEDDLLKRDTIVRIVSTGAQKAIGLNLVQAAEPADQPLLAGAYAQGQAVGGQKLEELELLPGRFPAPGREVELGILRGMIERMANITRTERDKEIRRKADEARGIVTPATAANATAVASVRYDVAAYYQRTFASRPLPAATAAYAGYLAFQGDLPAARSLAANAGDEAMGLVVANYYDYLGLSDRITGRETLHREVGLGADGVARGQLKLVEYTARNGLLTEAEGLKAAGTASNPALRDQYIRSYMRGIFYSRVALFRLTATTIPDLGLQDPAVCAEVLLDWVLSPNRLQKSSSWGADQILFKYFSMQKEGRPVSRQMKPKKS